jgi:hypothetical protein
MRIKGAICHIFLLFLKKVHCLAQSDYRQLQTSRGLSEKDGQKKYYILYNYIIYNKYIYNFLSLSPLN